MINVLVIALGLAMDCFGVSIVMGGNLTRKKLLSIGLLISGVFGLFHAVMLVGGILIEETLKSFISGVDHWIAFALLSIVGVKMIQSTHRDGKKFISSRNIDLRLILSLGVATSIDALIVGTGIAFLGTPIILTITTIGLVTFILSMIGFSLGIKGNSLLHKKAEIAGGFILVMMGIKILLDHWL